MRYQIAAICLLGLIVQGSFGQIPATLPTTVPAAARGRGARPPITYLPIKEGLPTLWIIGDSTVRNGSYEDGGNGQWGWGNPIRHYFDETKINIQNRAMGGTSSLSYRTNATLWPVVLPMIKPGDYLIIQFGHNDSGTPKGNGDEVVQRAARRGGRGAPATQPQPADAAPVMEEVHTFGWNIRKYVTDARERGMVEAIICSPIPRNRWTNGKIPQDGWAMTSKEAAETVGAKFFDLDAAIRTKYEELGKDTVTNELFPESGDAVHTSWAGAVLNAEIVIQGLKQVNSPLVKYLKPEAPKDLKHPQGKAR